MLRKEIEKKLCQWSNSPEILIQDVVLWDNLLSCTTIRPKSRQSKINEDASLPGNQSYPQIIKQLLRKLLKRCWQYSPFSVSSCIASWIHMCFSPFSVSSCIASWIHMCFSRFFLASCQVAKVCYNQFLAGNVVVYNLSFVQLFYWWWIHTEVRALSFPLFSLTLSLDVTALTWYQSLYLFVHSQLPSGMCTGFFVSLWFSNHLVCSGHLHFCCCWHWKTQVSKSEKAVSMSCGVRTTNIVLQVIWLAVISAGSSRLRICCVLFFLCRLQSAIESSSV